MFNQSHVRRNKRRVEGLKQSSRVISNGNKKNANSLPKRLLIKVNLLRHLPINAQNILRSIAFLSFFSLMAYYSMTANTGTPLATYSPTRVLSSPRILQIMKNGEFSRKLDGLERKLNRRIMPSHVTTMNVKQRKDRDKALEKESRDSAREHEQFETENCKAMHEWQKESYPTCNIVHEIDMRIFRDESDHDSKYIEILRFLSRGGFRDVWMTSQYDRTKLVLKTLRYKGNKFTYREYDRHRRDALVMDVMKFSKHVPDIYGYCVNSGLFDYAQGGDLASYLMRKGNVIPNEEKLRLAWQVAKALSELHTLGKIGGASAIAHTDITPHQYLWIDGMYKLNDFNRARFIRKNLLSGKQCPFNIAKSPGKFRSPEEYNNGNLTEKVDIYQMGNVFYTLLTNYEPFEGMKTEVANDLVMKGDHLKIPQQITRNADSAQLTLMEVITMCQGLDPLGRASAAEVEQYLYHKMNDLNIDFF